MTSHAADLSFVALLTLASLEEEALYNIGEAYLNLEQYLQALGFFQAALSLAFETNDRLLEASIFSRLSIVLTALGQLEQAAKSFQQAQLIFKELRAQAER